MINLKSFCLYVNLYLSHTSEEQYVSTSHNYMVTNEKFDIQHLQFFKNIYFEQNIDIVEFLFKT